MFVIEWYNHKNHNWQIAHTTDSKELHDVRKKQLLEDGLMIRVVK